MITRHRARLWLQSLEDRRVPATFTVTNSAESGGGSFRQAIIDANNSAGTDSIVFDSVAFSSPQTISLLTVLPTISGSVSIVGTGSSKVIVERNAAASDFRVLNISS